MQGRVPRMENHLSGVKCVVSSCYYYSEGDYCNAQNIEVQPRNATDSQETDCATYVPK